MAEKKDIRVALIALFGLDFGARSISAFLKKNSYPVSLILFDRKRYPLELLGGDYFNARPPAHEVCGEKDLELLIALLKKIAPKVIGISLTATTFQTARAITLEIKKHMNATVVWGGIHAIVCPEECIRYADIVCMGEGELPMLQLAEKLKNGLPISGIGSLWISGPDGIEKNELLPLIADLDELPFPDFAGRDDKFVIDGGRLAPEYDIVSAYERRTYPIMTSRGCMYACSFCSNSILKRRYEGKGTYLRRRSVDNVLAELKDAAAKRQFDHVRFWDDIFTFDAQWVNDFCARYPAEIGKRFTCYTHPKRTDKDMLIKLRAAGLCTASMGIQSGSEELSRQLFSRSQSNPDLLDFAEFADKIGVTARYDVIADNPYEADADEERTVDLLMRLPYPFQIQLYSMCWFPGTPLTSKALEDKTINEADLEQNSFKALSNFHMYISLSRGRRNLFWNCIKGMAVNRLFPAALTLRCMKSAFLKKYPAILFVAGKWYLALRSRCRLKLKNRRLRFTKKIPYNVARRVLELDGDAMGDIVVTGRADWLFKRPDTDHSFFPLPGGVSAMEYCFRIRRRVPAAKPVDYLFMLMAYDDYFLPDPDRTMWLMRVPAGGAGETDMRVKLTYPELSFGTGGEQGPAILLQRDIISLEAKRTYALVVRHGRHPYTIIDTVIFGN